MAFIRRFSSQSADLIKTAIKQNFSEQCENALNKQINMELYSSYVYLSMAYYFDRDDVALPGMHGYFKKESEEEREHAMKLMKYLNKRGGKICLTDIKQPEWDEWGTAKNAMCEALNLEKMVNENLLDLHNQASEKNDANLCDFLETHFLQGQVDTIKELADHIKNLERSGDGLGLFMFDKFINPNGK